jgi:membrane-bound lytic murein transglycosylase D
VLSLLLIGSGSAAAATADFPVAAALRAPVAFWKKIFGVYSEHQIVIHDAEHLSRVYSVLDYRDLVDRGESPIAVELAERDGMASEKERIRTLLLGFDARAGNDGGLSEEEQKIWNLFAKDNDPGKFAAAADPSRIRAQRGLKERFREGVRVSRRYLAQMEAIFRREGLPPELTRLPLVESCFDIAAYSKVGAAGIWQFMRTTGRSYMAIGGVLDERRDPLRATRGAAQHLKENYEALGSWPLAITAYNHGRAGMARAVGETGTTDIGQIVRHYHGPLFGFASRNFYAEFLAALQVEAAHRDYFGELQFERPFTGDEIPLAQPVSGRVAASCAEVAPEDLALLNPAVDGVVFTGRGNLPRGYLLRVPAGTSTRFMQRLAQIAADARAIPTPVRSKRGARPTTVVASAGGSAKRRAASETCRTHRVGKGQTLSHIARHYRVSVERLRGANSLRGSGLKPGQVLKIPTG